MKSWQRQQGYQEQEVWYIKKQGYLEKLKRRKTKITVGIWGVHSGAGVTTFAVALANFMSGFLRKKTAVYEYNSHGDFGKISDCHSMVKRMDGEGKFSINSVDYYGKGTIDIPNLNSMDYEIIIVDFGSAVHSLHEFMRCDYKMVISSTEPWYVQRYEEFLRSLQEYSGSDTWLHILACHENELKQIRKSYSIMAVKRPCIDNSYIIDSVLIQFFQTLFQEEKCF